MKTFISLILIGLTFPASAWWDGCLDEVNSLIKTEREQYILRTNKSLLEKLKLHTCSTEDVTVNLIVALHEGVHFLDLNLNAYPQLPTKAQEVKRELAHFYLASGKRMTIPNVKLTETRILIERFLTRIDWKSKSSELAGFSKEYLQDLTTLSSTDFILGVSTELNAYTQGFISAFSFSQQLNKEIESLAVQRGGMLFFLIVVQSYISQANFEQNKDWKILTSNKQVQSLLSELVENSIEILNRSNFCSAKTHKEEYVEAYRFARDLSSLTKVVGPSLAQDLEKAILCGN